MTDEEKKDWDLVRFKCLTENAPDLMLIALSYWGNLIDDPNPVIEQELSRRRRVDRWMDETWHWQKGPLPYTSQDIADKAMGLGMPPELIPRNPVVAAGIVVRPQLEVRISDMIRLKSKHTEAAGTLRNFGEWWKVLSGTQTHWIIASSSSQPRIAPKPAATQERLYKENDANFEIVQVHPFPAEFIYAKVHNPKIN